MEVMAWWLGLAPAYPCAYELKICLSSDWVRSYSWRMFACISVDNGIYATIHEDRESYTCTEEALHFQEV